MPTVGGLALEVEGPTVWLKECVDPAVQLGLGSLLR
jgi:hypothetical protein